VNFLAHFHLAWPDEGLVAGGLEGDYYKGPLPGELPEQLERGVKLHRAIDAYTDQHPMVKDLREQFPADLRRYAGILIDLCFDHYLSTHWEQFSDTPLPEFTGEVYAVLTRNRQNMSNAARQMLAHMVEHDILGLYRDWETVPRSAARIGQRFKRYNPLTDVDRGLEPLRVTMEQAFLDFYPDLRAFSGNWQSQ
jgi:acyl carrier protein phosphodiesterase